MEMKVVALSIALALGTSCLGQGVSFRHSLSAELADVGTYAGFGLSGRYDYMFKRNVLGFWNASISSGNLLHGWGGSPGYSIRGEVTFDAGKRNCFAEFGVATTFINYNETVGPYTVDKEYSFGPMAGFKFIHPQGFQLRAFVSAIGGYSTSRTMLISPSAGISVGWTFGRQ